MRHGERLDEAALLAWLPQAVGARDVVIVRLERLGGGAIQENWALDVLLDGSRRELVLRTDGATGVAVSWSRAQEFRILKAAHGAGVMVPRPVAVCDDPAILGRPFYLMQRVPGEARGAKLVRDPDVDGWGEAVAERLGAELARLHRLTPPVAGLEFMPVPRGPAALERVAEYRRLLDGLDAAEPVLEWALAWLERHAPPESGLCLVHADCRTGNYLVHAGRLTAVLDWEFAHFGDPLEDLGWMLMRAWRFGADVREAGGVGSRAAFFKGYEQESGRPVEAEAVPYWEVMGTVRWAVIALMQADRFFKGREPDLELALTAHVVPVLEDDLLARVHEIETGDP